jgi:hypothetical protein
MPVSLGSGKRITSMADRTYQSRQARYGRDRDQE